MTTPAGGEEENCVRARGGAEKEDLCSVYASTWLMSWGIVMGLLAMVATLLFCVGCLFSIAKEAPPGSGSKLDEPTGSVTQDSHRYRQAA
jgi:hypothetical protein